MELFTGMAAICSVYGNIVSGLKKLGGDDRRDSMTFQTTDIEINGEKRRLPTSIYDESNRVICDYFVYK